MHRTLLTPNRKARLLLRVVAAIFLAAFSFPALADSTVPALSAATSLATGSVYIANGGANDNKAGFTTSVFDISAGALTLKASGVTNAMLANSATTVNGTSCTLGTGCTVTAAAGTLSGSTLAAGVTASSLTSVGTLGGLTMGGTLALGTNSVTGNFTITGVPIMSGLSSGTQVSCIGLDAGNHVVLNNSACGTGGGGSANITAGSAGLVMSPSPITGTGTISLAGLTTVADANCGTLTAAGTAVVAFNTVLTAGRSCTLPTAASMQAGQRITFVDIGNGTNPAVNGANTITVNRASTDKILNGTSLVISTGYGSITLVSDGVATWGTPASVNIPTPGASQVLTSNSSSLPVWANSVTAGQMLPLTSAHLYVGNGSNAPADVAMSGDVALSNTGATTVSKIGGTAIALGTLTNGDFCTYTSSGTVLNCNTATPAATISVSGGGNTTTGVGTVAFGNGILSSPNGAGATATVTLKAPNRTVTTGGTTIISSDLAGQVNSNDASGQTFTQPSNATAAAGATWVQANQNTGAVTLSGGQTLNGLASSSLFQYGWAACTGNGTSADCFGWPGWGGLSGDVTSTAAGSTTVNKIGGKAITLGTLTDGDVCTYTASGTVLNCTTTAGVAATYSQTIGWPAAVNPIGNILWTAPANATITGLVASIEAATGGTSTVSVFKATAAQACASGAAIHSSSANANLTNVSNSGNQTLSVTTSAINSGDRLCLQTTGTTAWTGGSGIGAVTVKYTIP